VGLKVGIYPKTNHYSLIFVHLTEAKWTKSNASVKLKF